MMPAAMMLATASPALRTSSKLAMMQRATCGLGSSFTVTSSVTASMPSLPTRTRHQVEPGGIERLGAELDRLAFDGVAAHPQHVVQGQAVLQAVHAARVLGDVAADRAGDLAARIGRVVEAVRRRGFADGEVAHAALHRRGARARVDRDDAVELGQAQRHAERVRQRAARQAGAGAARDHRHFERVAQPQHGGDLRLRSRAARRRAAVRGRR